MEPIYCWKITDIICWKMAGNEPVINEAFWTFFWTNSDKKELCLMINVHNIMIILQWKFKLFAKKLNKQCCLSVVNERNAICQWFIHGAGISYSAISPPNAFSWQKRFLFWFNFIEYFPNGPTDDMSTLSYRQQAQSRYWSPCRPSDAIWRY